MSSRLSLLLTLNGVPSFDHTYEKSRMGFKIKDTKTHNIVRFEHPFKLPMYCLGDHQKLVALTTQILSKAGVEYALEGRTILVPNRKADHASQDNIPIFRITPPNDPRPRKIRRPAAR